MSISSESPSFPNGYRFWDSWYLHGKGEFHALMLCAEEEYYKQGQHHEHSQLAYARSRDLVNWEGHRRIELPTTSAKTDVLLH